MTNPQIPTSPAVEAHGLVKNFADMRAVDGVDLTVHRGEVFGVLGPNGAGKTTMLKMLATLLPIDAGEAKIFGTDVRTRPHVVRQLLGHASVTTTQVYTLVTVDSLREVYAAAHPRALE